MIAKHTAGHNDDNLACFPVEYIRCCMQGLKHTMAGLLRLHMSLSNGYLEDEQVHMTQLQAVGHGHIAAVFLGNGLAD